MKRTLELLEDLNQKIGLLTGKYADIKHESQELINQISELKKQLEDEKNENNKLEEQIRVMAVSGPVRNLSGTGNAKTRINQLVREIDMCIELLNK